MRHRISADLLHHFCSFKNGKYIQYSPVFETAEMAKNLSLSFLAELCGVALRQHRIMGQGNLARDFDPGDSRKNAGIPDVCPVFHTVRLGQTIRRSPQSPLCGAAFRKRSCHPSLSQWIPGSLPLFLCAAYYLLNSSRITSEVAIVWNVSPSTIRRLNSMS